MQEYLLKTWYEDMITINLKNVSKKFKQNDVLQDINLELESGKIYGIIGKNGSGKSVLLKMICGLIYPDNGEIIIMGKKLFKGYYPSQIGVMLDNTGFLPNYSAFENLKTIAIINNIISNEEIKNCIKLVGLDPNDKKKIKHYSTGMKQRLGIAQAIMEKPKILLLDEPMNALDSDSVEDTRKLIRDLVEQEKITVLLTSHNQEDINILCDEVYKIDKRRLVKC